jgi:hypothetical protein
MSVSGAQTSITALKALYAAFIVTLTHSDASTQALLRAQATASLDMWENAKNAAANVAASASSSYSNGVGMSLSKRRTDQAEADADRYLGEFRTVCLMGGVTIPTTEAGGFKLWDMSKVTV